MGNSHTETSIFRRNILHLDLFSYEITKPSPALFHKAITRLGGTSFVQTCSDLKVSILNNSDKEILKEIRNIERSSDPVPKGVRSMYMFSFTSNFISNYI